MAAVLDTNIWVSALQFGGKPLEIVQMALDGQIEIAISQSIIDETLRILRDKFKTQQPEIDRAIAIMDAAARKIEPTIKLDVVKNDSKDNHILECAVAAGAVTIVTGDKRHLLPLRAIKE